jgi:hypothetical protein
MAPTRPTGRFTLSINRSTFFVAAGGCLFGSMIPLLLGASQAPEKQFPRYSISGSGEHAILIVDNQKDELHVYRGMHSSELRLYKTIDLNQVGHSKISIQDRALEEGLKGLDEKLKRFESSPKTPK